MVKQCPILPELKVLCPQSFHDTISRLITFKKFIISIFIYLFIYIFLPLNGTFVEERLNFYWNSHLLTFVFKHCLLHLQTGSSLSQWDQLLPFGPRTGVKYSRLFKCTQEHTAVLQRTALGTAPPSNIVKYDFILETCCK